MNPLHLGIPPTGIDEHEALGVPLRLMHNTVAGDAGNILHHSLTATDDPIDQSRLADIGTTHHGENRESGLTGSRDSQLCKFFVEITELGSCRLERNVQGRIVGIFLEVIDIRADSILVIDLESDPIVVRHHSPCAGSRDRRRDQ